MKKEKNLIENKVLINTFKKFKLKNYLNKTFLKKKSFIFLKFKNKKLIKVNFFKNTLYLNTLKLPTYNSLILKNYIITFECLNLKKSLYKSTLNFIK